MICDSCESVIKRGGGHFHAARCRSDEEWDEYVIEHDEPPHPEPELHFCDAACMSSYATAKALGG